MPTSEPIGALLVRLRSARSVSQLRLAERLCAVSGVATVTRHEISRWERGERVPGRQWLRWLAAVLDVPQRELEAAAAIARARRAASAADSPLWTPVGATRLADLLDRVDAPDLARLAHAWLTEPSSRAPSSHEPSHEPGPTPAAWQPLPGSGPPVPADALAARILDLRRMDDLIGGPEFAGIVDRELRAALAGLRRDGPDLPLLHHVADLAQLAGWTAADAGRFRAATTAYRVGLAAASAADDRTLGAHLLGCLSHLRVLTDPPEALLLARSGLAGARQSSPAGVQALLQYRAALAAALAGERRASEEALLAAERLVDRRDAASEPSWLYWLDDAEVAALSGRTFAALHRPLRAEPLLRRRLDRIAAGVPRSGTARFRPTGAPATAARPTGAPTAGAGPEPPQDGQQHTTCPRTGTADATRPRTDPDNTARPRTGTAKGGPDETRTDETRTVGAGATGPGTIGAGTVGLGAAETGGPRTAAIDGAWLTEAYLDAGELEQACEAASAALLAAIRSGSWRAAARALAPRKRLLGTCPAADRYAELLAEADPYLPRPAPGGTATRAKG